LRQTKEGSNSSWLMITINSFRGRQW
jgi:hypothetical protein